LVKFLAQALGAHPEDVISPTFVLIHPIDTYPQIYHIDAYRIHDSDEFLELGIEELFEQQAITIIEWADRFVECMPKNTLWIELACEDPQSHSIKKSLCAVRLTWTWWFEHPSFLHPEKPLRLMVLNMSRGAKGQTKL
jgi:tRNA threonylcarbamoyladenosine biosynthesis protein TsaE